MSDLERGSGSGETGTETQGESGSVAEQIAETRAQRDADRADPDNWGWVDPAEADDPADPEPWTAEELAAIRADQGEEGVQAAIRANETDHGQVGWNRGEGSTQPAPGVDAGQGPGVGHSGQAAAGQSTGPLAGEHRQGIESKVQLVGEDQQPHGREVSAEDSGLHGPVDLPPPTDAAGEDGDGAETGEGSGFDGSVFEDADSETSCPLIVYSDDPSKWNSLPYLVDYDDVPPTGSWVDDTEGDTAPPGHEADDAVAEEASEEPRYHTTEDVREAFMAGKSVPEVREELLNQPLEPKPEPTTEIVRPEGDLTYEVGDPAEAPDDLDDVLERDNAGSRVDQSARWSVKRETVEGLQDTGKTYGQLLHIALENPRPTGAYVGAPQGPIVVESRNDAVDGAAVLIAPALLWALGVSGVRSARERLAEAKQARGDG